MASPVITSITASPATIPPGGTSVVTIVAHDPDQTSGVLTGTVTDSQGNAVPAQVTINISDPLTFELVDADGVGFTITPKAGQPGAFDVRAPG